MSKNYLISLLVLSALHISDANHIGHNHTKVRMIQNRYLEQIQTDADENANIPPSGINEEEYNGDYLMDLAAQQILEALAHEPNTGVAKNCIIIVSENTPLSALRQIRKYRNNCQPSYGISKTEITHYFRNIAFANNKCPDTPNFDGACSTNAIVTGVQTNAGTIAVGPRVTQCTDELQDIDDDKLTSFLTWAQKGGKRTGIVTTSRVTDPNVSPTYANSCNGDFEADTDLPPENVNFQHEDIASQLINSETGQNLNVIMGGGRANFFPQRRGGVRKDGRNLIREFIRQKRSIQSEFAYVTDLDEISDVCIHTDHVLALFNDQELDPETDPSLKDLVETALILLNRPGNDGYVLFVQQANQAYRTIDEDGNIDPQAQIENTQELLDAAQTAYSMTDPENTLIIVTSNYVNRNYLSPTNDENEALDGDDDNVETGKSDSEIALAELSEMEDDGITSPDSECQIEDGEEDSFVLASGPWAHLYSGFIDQELIPHIAAFATCIGDGLNICGA